MSHSILKFTIRERTSNWWLSIPELFLIDNGSIHQSITADYGYGIREIYYTQGGVNGCVKRLMLRISEEEE